MTAGERSSYARWTAALAIDALASAATELGDDGTLDSFTAGRP
jgi:hypothetical protein